MKWLSICSITRASTSNNCTSTHRSTDQRSWRDSSLTWALCASHGDTDWSFPSFFWLCSVMFMHQTHNQLGKFIRAEITGLLVSENHIFNWPVNIYTYSYCLGGELLQVFQFLSSAYFFYIQKSAYSSFITFLKYKNV